MTNLKIILGDPKSFLNRVFSSLALDGIDVTSLELDHICYRVETIERYEFLKKEMHNLGELLIENNVSGRPILSFRLFKPIVHKKREIFVIEIPAPKKNNFYPEGYEHAEFVIGCRLEEFMKLYPGIKFDTRAINKDINPEVIINYKEHAIKFHENSLEFIIEKFER